MAEPASTGQVFVKGLVHGSGCATLGVLAEDVRRRECRRREGIFITNICMLEGDALVVKSNYIDVVSFPKTGVEQFLTTGVKASLLFRIRISSVSLRRCP